MFLKAWGLHVHVTIYCDIWKCKKLLLYSGFQPCIQFYIVTVKSTIGYSCRVKYFRCFVAAHILTERVLIKKPPEH